MMEQDQSKFQGEPAMRILSLGAGVQSSTMALMAEEGAFGIKPDAAIFADTGWEPKPVIEHLNWLKKQCQMQAIVLLLHLFLQKIQTQIRRAC